MRKLLRANLSRLLGDRLFLLLGVGMLAFGVFTSCNEYRFASSIGATPSIDSVLFTSQMVIGLVLALLCGLFLGVEYGDGTMRNKLATGAKRVHVYLANYITCALAGLAFDVLYLVAVCAVGFPLMGLPTMPLGQFAQTMGIGALVTLSFSAVFTLIPMLIANRAIAAVVCLLGIIAMFMGAANLSQQLSSPEMLSNITIDENGAMSTTDDLPNPNYIPPEQRVRYETMMDMIPVGQAVQLNDQKLANPVRMAVCSLALILAANAAGVIVFARKDLK